MNTVELSPTSQQFFLLLEHSKAVSLFYHLHHCHSDKKTAETLLAGDTAVTKPAEYLQQASH